MLPSEWWARREIANLNVRVQNGRQAHGERGLRRALVGDDWAVELDTSALFTGVAA